MKMEHRTLTIQLDDDELKQVAKEYRELIFNSLSDKQRDRMRIDCPFLYDFLHTLSSHEGGNKMKTDRKLNTF